VASIVPLSHSRGKVGWVIIE